MAGRGSSRPPSTSSPWDPCGSAKGRSHARPRRAAPGGFLGLEAFLRGTTQGPPAEETCFLAVIDADHREAFIRSQPALVLDILGS